MNQILCKFVKILKFLDCKSEYNLSFPAQTSPCLELSCTAAVTVSVLQFYDPAKEKVMEKKNEVSFPPPGAALGSWDVIQGES